MEMYDKNVEADNYNVSIDGYSMIMEEVTPNEAYNRRETIRHNIIGGTQQVMRGNYICRDYTFTTHLLIDPKYPDVYDDVFLDWQSKACEVISRYMGGKFDAEVIVKPHPNDSPNYLNVEIQVIEIPSKSNIPNDSLDTPTDKVTPVKITSTKNSKKKTSKNTKNKKSTKKNKKKKGSNITKVRK